LFFDESNTDQPSFAYRNCTVLLVLLVGANADVTSC
jgi:hypothetical protein